MTSARLELIIRMTPDKLRTLWHRASHTWLVASSSQGAISVVEIVRQAGAQEKEGKEVMIKNRDPGSCARRIIACGGVMMVPSSHRRRLIVWCAAPYSFSYDLERAKLFVEGDDLWMSLDHMALEVEDAQLLEGRGSRQRHVGLVGWLVGWSNQKVANAQEKKSVTSH